jgi:hypothetical protein
MIIKSVKKDDRRKYFCATDDNRQIDLNIEFAPVVTHLDHFSVSDQKHVYLPKERISDQAPHRDIDIEA